MVGRPRQGVVETRGDRRALAADAGMGAISLGSVLAGVLVAYGAFAILIGIAAAIVDAVGIDTDIVTTDYEQLSIVGGLIVAGILFLSYLFGGYVAGRMARRSGLVNGVLVAVLGLVIAGGVAALVRSVTDTESIVTELRSLGVPTTADEYGQAFTVAGIASLVALVLGSIVGGTLGERWHGKLLSKAMDPTVGTEAAARQRAQEEMARAEEERTLAYERSRTASPLRARRSDRDALSEADRRFVESDTIGHDTTGPGAVRDRGNRRSDGEQEDDRRPRVASAWRSGRTPSRTSTPPQEDRTIVGTGRHDAEGEVNGRSDPQERWGSMRGTRRS